MGRGRGHEWFEEGKCVDGEVVRGEAADVKDKEEERT